MNFKLLLMSIVLALMAVSLPATAHHSFAAGYLPDQHVTVTGAVSRFDYMSPHSIIFIDVTDPGGTKKAWVLEFGSPLVLGRLGWSGTTFKVGDIIEVTGAPSRTGAPRLYVSELHRAADGFEYKAKATPTPTP